tara:strand:+ start:53 stop:1312 length:1260 start_codon:yes stop_codon:yes gene_type:complete
MITLLLLGCSDHLIAYPVEENGEDNVEDTAIYDVSIITPDDQEDDEIIEDTGYEEPIEEEEDVIEDTGYEEEIEEPEEEEIEEPDEEEIEEPEEIEEEVPVTITVDNFNYDDSFVISSNSGFSFDTAYADDMGWDMIASDGRKTCGLLPSGYIDCECEMTGYPTCSVTALNNVIPFETFVDLSITTDALCALKADGTTTCYHTDTTTYTPPTTDSIDIVALSDGSSNSANTLCTLESTGYLFCFDTETGGMVHSDGNLYKAIEGHGSWVCGVHISGPEISCHRPISQQTYNRDWSNQYQEIIGFDSGNGGYCATFIDNNNMQVAECVNTGLIGWFNPTASNGWAGYSNCLESAPHQYYYDFFTVNADISNIKIDESGHTAMIVTDLSYEIQWGGLSGTNRTPLNNGYYTGAGCNYYWGN